VFNPAAVTVVEWPERIPGLLADTGPDGRPAAERLFPVHIESLDETRRRFRLPASLKPPSATICEGNV
jgi:tRNA A37 threonylcarbamoyladenosine biosynthesis protein TsaE